MKPPTVLVVDDDADIRDIARLSLERVAEWQVLTAGDGPSAIEIACSHHLDVVLLDVMMPGLDGPATFDALQAEAATRDIPVIMFTAKLQVSGPPDWGGRAVRGVIGKPFDPIGLADEIRRILRWDTDPGLDPDLDPSRGAA